MTLNVISAGKKQKCYRNTILQEFTYNVPWDCLTDKGPMLCVIMCDYIVVCLCVII